MFSACQINSCCSQPESFEKKNFGETVELYSHCVTLQTFRDLRNASRFCVCGLSIFFLYHMKAIDEEICPSGFRNCYIYFKTTMIVFVSLRPIKSQANFRNSQKISNIYLKRLLSYSNFNLMWVESTPPPGQIGLKIDCKMKSQSSF